MSPESIFYQQAALTASPITASTLRQWIAFYGVRRVDLAQYIGVEVDTLRKYTNGRRRIPLEAQIKMITYFEQCRLQTAQLAVRAQHLAS